jgi:hypothetical protein
MSGPRVLVVWTLAALLGACAASGPQRFPPGSTRATVMQGMGAPTGEHPLPNGGRRLEYAGGAFGRQTHMFDFDTADRLLRWQQVRDEAHFNAIQAGMRADEVLSRIGRPSTTWAIPRQRQIVWSYRYETHFCQWFMVGMGHDDRVIDTSYGPDPLCDRDDFWDRFRGR